MTVNQGRVFFDEIFADIFCHIHGAFFLICRKSVSACYQSMRDDVTKYSRKVFFYIPAQVLQNIA